MQIPFFLITSLAVSSVSGCPDHTSRQRAHVKRQASPTDWSYDHSYDWGAIKPAYATCQTGTQQSPIGLSLADGSSTVYQPTFANYDGNVTGEWTNWKYGPQFTLDVPNDDYTSLPTMTFNNVTVYLSGWHTHAPSEHSIDGNRAKAEMHLVHVNANGDPAAVVSILIDVGTAPWAFLTQLPPYIPFTWGSSPRPIMDPGTGEAVKAEVVEGVEMNMALALEGADNLNTFWTYKGSLTTPPCTEGARWFVGQTTALASVEQVRELLGVSTFSARETQEVWEHDVNEA
ncbi:MAG: hypothetical protein Q9174_001249 [Haloplaca sp. 1 TL-2023]